MLGIIKDRNSRNLTKAERIRRGGKNTPKLYKKHFNDPDNHNSVITHLESDTLECEVKGALGSFTMKKASGYNGIPAEQCHILKDECC